MIPKLQVCAAQPAQVNNTSKRRSTQFKCNQPVELTTNNRETQIDGGRNWINLRTTIRTGQLPTNQAPYSSKDYGRVRKRTHIIHWGIL